MLLPIVEPRVSRELVSQPVPGERELRVILPDVGGLRLCSIEIKLYSMAGEMDSGRLSRRNNKMVYHALAGRKNFCRLFFVASLALLLSACKLTIIVPTGGSVT